MQPPGSQPLSANLAIQSFQWQPETYAHRNESGGDGGKVPYMIIYDLTAPIVEGSKHKRLLVLFVGILN